MTQDNGRSRAGRLRRSTQAVQQSHDGNILNFGTRNFGNNNEIISAIEEDNNEEEMEGGAAVAGDHGEEVMERATDQEGASQDNSVIEFETSDNDVNFPAFEGDHNEEDMERVAHEEEEAAVVDDTENSGTHDEEGADRAASEGGEEVSEGGEESVSVLLDRLSISYNNGETDESNNVESNEDNNNNNNSSSSSESDEDDNNSESDEENNDAVSICRYCQVEIPPGRAVLPLLSRIVDDPNANHFFGTHFRATHTNNGVQYHCLPWGTLSPTIIFNDIKRTLLAGHGGNLSLEAVFLGLNGQPVCQFIEFVAIARSFLLQPGCDIDIIEEIGFRPDGNMQRHVLVADYIRIWQRIINNDRRDVRRTVTNRFGNSMTNHLNRHNWQGNVQDRLNQLLREVESTDPLTEEALEASINGAFDFVPSTVLPEIIRNTMNKTIFHRLNDIVVLVNRLRGD